MCPATMPNRSQKWALKANPMAEDIIATALQFVGFPYMWAGTSIKAMDCSGLVKTVLYLNGVITLRDASQQARMGEQVDMSDGWKNLQMADLLFFGRKATKERPESITHVGIYIGRRTFCPCCRQRTHQFLRSGKRYILRRN